MSVKPEEFFRLKFTVDRLGMDPTPDTLIPLADVGSARRGGDEAGWCYATKAVDPLTVDGKTMSCTGVVTDETPDRSKEVVVADGIDWAEFALNPLGLFQHNRMAPVSKYIDPASGRSTLQRRGKQMVGTAFFVQKGPAPLVEMASQVFQLVECKVLNGLSLGFISSWKDHKRVPDDVNEPFGPGTTFIQKCRPFEISHVFFPDNSRAMVTEVVRKGLGNRPLVPVLLKSLAPFADPETVWAVSGWAPPAAETTAPAATVSTKETPVAEEKKCVTCKGVLDRPAGDVCKGCHITALEGEVARLKGELEKVESKEVKAAADRLAFYEKAVGDRVGLPLAAYPGKLTAKALKAMHDQTMFAAVNALSTIDEVEGAAEKALRDHVGHLVAVASQVAHQYKEILGEEIPGATPPDVLKEALSDPSLADPTLKAMADACVRWTVSFKGWRAAHATRAKAAAECLREAGHAAAALGEPAKAKCLAASRALEEMVAENGTLRHVEDEQVAAIVKELQGKLDDLDKKYKKTREELNKARAGVPY